MQQKGKFSLSVKRLWVSSRKGYPNGYGDSPAMACDNAMLKKKEINESLSLQQQRVGRAVRREYARLLPIIEQERREVARLKKEVSRLEDELRRARRPDLEIALSKEKSEGWVLALMVVYGERDPIKAIEKVLSIGRVRVGKMEHDAAKRLVPILDTFARSISIGMNVY